MYKLCCRSDKQWKIFKTRPRSCTTLLRDLKWIHFNSILRLNEASFIYKTLYVSADSNVKKINFDLRNKVLQRIQKRLRCTCRLSKNSSGTKSCVSIGRNAVEFDPNKYQKFKYHRYVQKSYVPQSSQLQRVHKDQKCLHSII